MAHFPLLLRLLFSGCTVVSLRTSDSGGPDSILARGRPPCLGRFSVVFLRLKANTGVVPLRIAYAVCLPFPSSPSSRHSSIIPYSLHSRL